MIKSKFLLVFILVIIFIFLVLVVFKYNPILEGRPGWSKSIAESKKRGVFIEELSLKYNPIYINDSLKIYINSAWFEHMWSYGKYLYNSTKHKSLKRIIMVVDKELMSKYNITWRIQGFGYHEGILMKNFIKNINTSQVLEFPIYSLDDKQEFPVDHPLDQIGILVLQKK